MDLWARSVSVHTSIAAVRPWGVVNGWCIVHTPTASGHPRARMSQDPAAFPSLTAFISGRNASQCRPPATISPSCGSFNTDLGEIVAPGASSQANFRLPVEHPPGSRPCLAQTPPFSVSLPSGERGRLRSLTLSVHTAFSALSSTLSALFATPLRRHNPAPPPIRLSQRPRLAPTSPLPLTPFLAAPCVSYTACRRAGASPLGRKHRPCLHRQTSLVTMALLGFASFRRPTAGAAPRSDSLPVHCMDLLHS